MKTCRKCSVPKDLSKFSRSRSQLDGLHTVCKACNAAYYRANTPQARDRKRRQEHGVEPEVFWAKMKEQRHGCRVCGRALEGNAVRIDSLERGVILGLLCPKCYPAVAWFRDRPGSLLALVEYLRSPRVTSGDSGDSTLAS